MRTKRTSLLLLTFLIAALLACRNVTAADKASSPDRDPKSGGLTAILDAVGSARMPSLSGLIQPEKMGLLADNKLTANDNEAHLLSDNEADVEILSDNAVNILSGIRLFSGVTVKVKISVHGDREKRKPKAKKGKNNRKSRKSNETDSNSSVVPTRNRTNTTTPRQP